MEEPNTDLVAAVDNLTNSIEAHNTLTTEIEVAAAERREERPERIKKEMNDAIDLVLERMKDAEGSPFGPTAPGPVVDLESDELFPERHLHQHHGSPLARITALEGLMTTIEQQVAQLESLLHDSSDPAVPERRETDPHADLVTRQIKGLEGTLVKCREAGDEYLANRTIGRILDINPNWTDDTDG